MSVYMTPSIIDVVVSKNNIYIVKKIICIFNLLAGVVCMFDKIIKIHVNIIDESEPRQRFK